MVGFVLVTDLIMIHLVESGKVLRQQTWQSPSMNLLTITRLELDKNNE